MAAGSILPTADPGRAIEAPAERRAGAPWLVLALVCGVWFLTLGARHLLPSDEGRYAEIAREMFASGDWVTIRYNGLKYFEKPPFHLWATALAYEAFGVGDWQARLWSALSAAGGLGIAAVAARRWFGNRAALLTGCVLLAAPAWNLAGHFNSLDISVAAALTVALAALLMAQHPLASMPQRRHWMWLAWAAMGVAILTKGLIGIVLPGLALLVYTAVARDTAVWRRLHLVSGTLILLLVTVPWFVAVSVRNPEFPQFFFIHEHWERYTSGVHHRTGSWWYFIPQFVLGFLPWLGLLPRIVGVVARESAPRETPGRGDGDVPGPPPNGFRPALFLAVWVSVIFVFFSISNSKLPGYIIPIYPALAILAGAALDAIDRPAWQRQLVAMLLLATVGLLATPFVARLGRDPESVAAFSDFAPWVAAACGVAIAGLAYAWVLNRHRRTPSIVAYALAFFAMTTIAMLGHEAFGRTSSGVALVAPIRAAMAVEPGMPIYSVRLLDHTLPFYLRRTTVMVEAPDELDFGTRQEPAKWLPSIAAFIAVWKAPHRGIAIMSHDTFTSLRGQGLAMVPVAEDRRRVVVANFALSPP